jgi:hypothetical protein
MCARTSGRSNPTTTARMVLVAVVLMHAFMHVAASSAQERYDAGKKAMAAGDMSGALDHFHFACGRIGICIPVH